MPTATAVPAAATATGGEASAPPLPNAPAGYDLLDHLGAGGMGAVFLAREQAADRLVAMKFLRQPAAPDALDRFLVELRVLARLDHPNIVRVLASDFLRADPYFTMEHMPGGSLSRAIDAVMLIPVAEAVRLIRTVADAITAAHAQGVIHRDLKPSNILLAADGTPKVSDFGLAKRLDADDQLTVTGGALGTPSYMPPEQISKKNGEIGPWSDVYGLGATLYHLLVGRAPFGGDSSEGIITQVLIDPPPRLRALRRDIPAALEGIVLKCLEKDPKDRYQTMAELAADLDRFTAGQRPVAPPLTRWRRAKRWAKRNRWGVAASVAGAVAVVGLSMVGRALFPVQPVHGGNNPAAATNPVPEPNPVEEAQSALAQGKPVTLIGEKTGPRWHAWRLTPATLGPGPLPDAACAFQTKDSTLLVLLPDPGVDRYRFSIELRQMNRLGKGQGAADGVGVFFGCDTRAAAQNRRVTTLVGATYFDVLRLVPGGPPLKNHARAESGFILETPQNLPRHFTFAEGAAPFEASPIFPGPWRKFLVDVSPTLVRIWWCEEIGKEPKLLHEWTGDELRTWYAGLASEIDKRVPGHGLSGPPVWHPRMALGVWAYQSSVAMRNAVVTPVP